jgi:hypothetical protein
MAVDPLPPKGGPREPAAPRSDHPPSGEHRSRRGPTARRNEHGRKAPVPLEILVLLIAIGAIVAVIVLA